MTTMTQTHSTSPARATSHRALLLASLLLALPACFQITEYDYEGQNFEFAIDADVPEGEYTTADFVTGTIVLDQPLESNLGAEDDLVDIGDRIVMYEFEDGRLRFDEDDSAISVAVATDAGGNIVFWSISVSDRDGNDFRLISTRNDADATSDVGQIALDLVGTDFAFNSNDPGDWIRVED